MIISSLNIIGGSNKQNRMRTSQAWLQVKLRFFFIQETKLKVVYIAFINSLWGLQNVGWSCSNAIGQLGCLLI